VEESDETRVERKNEFETRVSDGRTDSLSLPSFLQIRLIDRKQEVPHDGAMCDLLWSDPDGESSSGPYVPAVRRDFPLLIFDFHRPSFQTSTAGESHREELVFSSEVSLVLFFRSLLSSLT